MMVTCPCWRGIQTGSRLYERVTDDKSMKARFSSGLPRPEKCIYPAPVSEIWPSTVSFVSLEAATSMLYRASSIETRAVLAVCCHHNPWGCDHSRRWDKGTIGSAFLLFNFNRNRGWVRQVRFPGQQACLAMPSLGPSPDWSDRLASAVNVWVSG